MTFVISWEIYDIMIDEMIPREIVFDALEELKIYLDQLPEEKYITNKYTIFTRK